MCIELQAITVTVFLRKMKVANKIVDRICIMLVCRYVYFDFFNEIKQYFDNKNYRIFHSSDKIESIRKRKFFNVSFV